eukprot:TRINITY_DN24885_c0_g1_i1.p1 TRINITY_DN24885_c0_g1~~TRINITY_DN24885_c0_g1_i1.p1  ORF type:complete len:411 (+),score=160.59 TRINITY_DN24885_c0_g1_i1:56-1234(+)
MLSSLRIRLPQGLRSVPDATTSAEAVSVCDALCPDDENHWFGVDARGRDRPVLVAPPLPIPVQRVCDRIASRVGFGRPTAACIRRYRQQDSTAGQGFLAGRRLAVLPALADERLGGAQDGVAVVMLSGSGQLLFQKGELPPACVSLHQGGAAVVTQTSFRSCKHALSWLPGRIEREMVLLTLYALDFGSKPLVAPEPGVGFRDGGRSAPGPALAPLKPKALPKNWDVCSTAAGAVYYRNTRTGAVRATTPPLSAVEEAEERAAAEVKEAETRQRVTAELERERKRRAKLTQQLAATPQLEEAGRGDWEPEPANGVQALVDKERRRQKRLMAAARRMLDRQLEADRVHRVRAIDESGIVASSVQDADGQPAELSMDGGVLQLVKRSRTDDDAG